MPKIEDLSVANSQMEICGERPLSPILISSGSRLSQAKRNYKRRSRVNLAERFQSKSETSIDKSNESQDQQSSSFLSALTAVERIKKLEKMERERLEIYEILSQNSPKKEEENEEFQFKKPLVTSTAKKNQQLHNQNHKNEEHKFLKERDEVPVKDGPEFSQFNNPLVESEEAAAAAEVAVKVKQEQEEVKDEFMCSLSTQVMQVYLESVEHENQLKENIRCYENQIKVKSSHGDGQQNVIGGWSVEEGQRQNLSKQAIDVLYINKSASTKTKIKRKRENTNSPPNFQENENNEHKKLKRKQEIPDNMLEKKIRCFEEDNRIEIDINESISIKIKCPKDTDKENEIESKNEIKSIEKSSPQVKKSGTNNAQAYVPTSSDAFVGFMTGYSKKAIKISERALDKAKNLMKECYDNLISSSTSVPNTTTTLASSPHKKLTQNERKLLKNGKTDQENEIFEACSYKTQTSSNLSIENALILEATSTPESEEEIKLKEGQERIKITVLKNSLFSTGNNKLINIPEKKLKEAQQKLQVVQNDKIEAQERMQMAINKVNNANRNNENVKSNSFFNTGNNKQINIPENKLKQAQEKMQRTMQKVNSADSSANSFFNTGNNKKIDIPENKLKEARQKVNSADSSANLFFNTGNNKKIDIPENKLKEARQRVNSGDSNSFFNTGNNKQIIIPENKLKEARQRVNSGDSGANKSNSFFNTGNNKQINIPENKLKEARQRVNTADSDANKLNSFFNTGNNKKIDIPENKLKEARQRVNSADLCANLPEIKLKEAQLRMQKDEDVNKNSFFSTGSNKKIDIPEKRLKEAQEKLQIVVQNDPNSKSNSFFNSGNNKKIYIPENKLKEAQERMQNVEKNTSVFKTAKQQQQQRKQQQIDDVKSTANKQMIIPEKDATTLQQRITVKVDDKANKSKYKNYHQSYQHLKSPKKEIQAGLLHKNEEQNEILIYQEHLNLIPACKDTKRSNSLFNTGSNKPIKLSEAALNKQRSKLLQEQQQQQQEQASSSNFHNSQPTNSKLRNNDNCYLEGNKHFIVEDGKLNKVKVKSFFTTGANNSPIELSESELKKHALLFNSMKIDDEELRLKQQSRIDEFYPNLHAHARVHKHDETSNSTLQEIELEKSPVNLRQQRFDSGKFCGGESTTVSKRRRRTLFKSGNDGDIEISDEAMGFAKRRLINYPLSEISSDSNVAHTISTILKNDVNVVEIPYEKVPNEVLNKALNIYEKIKDYHRKGDEAKDGECLKEAINFFENETELTATRKDLLDVSNDSFETLKSPRPLTDTSSHTLTSIEAPKQNITSSQSGNKKLGPRKPALIKIPKEKLVQAQKEIFYDIDPSTPKILSTSTPLKECGSSSSSYGNAVPYILKNKEKSKNSNFLTDANLTPIRPVRRQERREKKICEQEETECDNDNGKGDSILLIEGADEETDCDLKEKLFNEFNKLKKKMEIIHQRWENLDQQLKSIENKDESLRRFKPGSKFKSTRKADNNQQIRIRLPLLRVVKNKLKLNINIENAINVNFNLKLKLNECVDVIKIGIGGEEDEVVDVIPNERHLIGFGQIKNAFLAMPGVDPQKLVKNWVENHFKLVVWKFSIYDTHFGDDFSYKPCLNVENIIRELKYRYDRDVYQCERSALRKMFEGDESTHHLMVLCVTNILQDCNEIELTDGWYRIKCLIDEPLKALLRHRKICIGQKLIIHGASFENHVPCHPLQASEDVRLKIHYNSTRKAKLTQKLGLQRLNSPFIIPMKSVHQNGGQIPCLKIYIARIYPTQFVESETGIWRNEKAEFKVQQKFQNLYEQNLENVQLQILDEMKREKEEELKERKNRNNKKLVTLGADTQTLYECFEKCDEDPELVFENFTNSQLNRVLKHKEKVTTQEELEFTKRVIERMKELQIMDRRKVTVVIKLLVLNENSDINSANTLTIWNSLNSDLESSLKEGDHYLAFNLTARNYGLAATNFTTFKKIPGPLNSNALRKITKISELSVLNKINRKPIFCEFDTIGIVVKTNLEENYEQCLWLSDEKHAILLVKMKKCECEIFNDLTPGKVIVISNLIYLNQSLAKANNYTSVSMNGKCLYFEQLSSCDTSYYVKHAEKCIAEKLNDTTSNLMQDETNTKMEIDFDDDALDKAMSLINTDSIAEDINLSQI